MTITLEGELLQILPNDPKLSWFPWNGSKRWLLSKLSSILRVVPSFNAYIEPFVGGGSVSYLMRHLYPNIPQNIADANPWLIAAYSQQVIEPIGYDIDEVATKILWYRKLTDADLEHLDVHQQALRFAICLMTAWGNRWETHSSGEFRSTINARFCERDYLDKTLQRFFTTRWLSETDTIMACDWKKIVALARPGDLVYLDPPYPDSLGYGNQLWDFSDQLDLVDWSLEANNSGIFVMISNMATIERLYRRGGFHTQIVSGPRSMKTRAIRQEVIAWNWE